MIPAALHRRFYGEPGNPKYNGTLAFYSLIRRHVRPDSVVLNLGAGPPTGDKTRILKGEAAEIVGADIDPVVLTNSELDRAVVTDGRSLPFANASFDLVFSDYVLEHVEQPAAFLAEVHRVLKPGASLFFRTPNLFHYIALVSRATPHWVHAAVANRARGLADDAHEPWPVFYRLNTRGTIRRLARQAGFQRAELQMIECEPVYLMFHTIPFLAGVAYERTVNSTELLAGLRANIFGRLVK
jgi:ubiquinone/menaquinone biosynthesis C-methylase UbiE